tara:strand:+ start:383 stop:1438 length:1056 start_codon:yes stop_codon:yes gene_type:complete
MLLKRIKMKDKIVINHLLPGMYRGGVEVGIKKSYKDINKNFNYKVFYIKRRGIINVNQKSFFLSFFKIISNKTKPSIIITSLWWSHFFGYFLRVFGFKWIVFIHSPKFSSYFDKIFTHFALNKSSYFFFDSTSSHSVFKNKIKGKSFIIPYNFDDSQLGTKLNLFPKYDFSWIGRNSKEKRLDLLFNFFEKLETKKIKINALLVLSGKKLKRFEAFSKNFKYVNIEYIYNIDSSKANAFLSESKINLCFSDYEGFSSTSFEAIKRGNIIASRCVGEIPFYTASKSRVFLEDLDEKNFDNFVNRIIDLLDNQDLLNKMRDESRKYLSMLYRGKLYSKTFIESIKSILNENIK